MKTENNRLGRCSSCRYWRSATDLVAERAGPDASDDDVNSARLAVRQELSQNLLDVDQANFRGWCLSAESGVGCNSTLLAVNLSQLTPARMITLHDFGCLNYEPRPRRAMNAPPPDFSRNRELGRCVGCRHWSSAENEATAIFSIERYTDPTSNMESAQRQAYDMLSPEPLDPATATLRGWCKIASDYNNPRTKNLAFDSASGSVGGLITGRDFACTRQEETRNPFIKITPSWRWMIDPLKMHNLGPAASLNELLMSHLDPATLLDETHPLSPLHPDHPLNIRNPRSLYFNPNPAFAAYVVNPSLVNTITAPMAYRQDETTASHGALVDSNHPGMNLSFVGDTHKDAATVYTQAMRQARLVQDFSSRTVRVGDAAPVEPVKSSGGVSLVKKGASDERRKERPKAPAAKGGFIDRRRN